jgi:hypothetical protein
METIIYLSAIVSFITLIVFFVMASNLAKIRNELMTIRKHIAPVQKEHEFLADRAYIRGEDKQAIAHLKEYLFEIGKYTSIERLSTLPKWKEEESRIQAKIQKFGGTVEK